MTVIVLTACPAGLRGYLTQWLLEIAAGVYVGHVSSRVRTRLWGHVLSMAGTGRAIMIFQRRGEQRLGYLVHEHDWQPVDVEGILLMLRPASPLRNPALPNGWSKAAKRRRFGRRAT